MLTEAEFPFPGGIGYGSELMEAHPIDSERAERLEQLAERLERAGTIDDDEADLLHEAAAALRENERATGAAIMAKISGRLLRRDGRELHEAPADLIRQVCEALGVAFE